MNPLIVLLMLALAGAIVRLIYEALRNSRRFPSFRFRELHLSTRQKTVLLLALAWTALYLIFLFFWLPQNTFYRLFYLPALILLFGLALSSFRTEASRPRRITALFVVAVALANFLFLIYPFSRVEKYPPLAFALRMNHEWPTGTVIYYAAQNSDKALVRYFNPSTTWKLLPQSFETLDAEIDDIYRKGNAAWLENTAITQLKSTHEGRQWIDRHMQKEKWIELDDKAYNIAFLQVIPEDR